MSCVISMTAAPRDLQMFLSSWMICAWMDTSSAVVGSSATMSLGSAARARRNHHALAHAAGELVRVVIDARSAAGMPVSAAGWMARSRASAALTGRCARMVSVSCGPRCTAG